MKKNKSIEARMERRRLKLDLKHEKRLKKAVPIQKLMTSLRGSR
jgi:hypothetical protein